MNLVPWKCGQLLVLDATYPDICTPSYRHQATCAAGKVAAAVEMKARKYAHLNQAYLFNLVTIETNVHLGPSLQPF